MCLGAFRRGKKEAVDVRLFHKEWLLALSSQQVSELYISKAVKMVIGEKRGRVFCDLLSMIHAFL